MGTRIGCRSRGAWGSVRVFGGFRAKGSGISASGLRVRSVFVKGFGLRFMGLVKTAVDRDNLDLQGESEMDFDTGTNL